MPSFHRFHADIPRRTGPKTQTMPIFHRFPCRYSTPNHAAIPRRRTRIHADIPPACPSGILPDTHPRSSDSMPPFHHRHCSGPPCAIITPTVVEPLEPCGFTGMPRNPGAWPEGPAMPIFHPPTMPVFHHGPNAGRHGLPDAAGLVPGTGNHAGKRWKTAVFHAMSLMAAARVLHDVAGGNHAGIPPWQASLTTMVRPSLRITARTVAMMRAMPAPERALITVFSCAIMPVFHLQSCRYSTMVEQGVPPWCDVGFMPLFHRAGVAGAC